MALLFGSCRKDDINFDTIDNNPPITTTTEASVYGIIKDSSNNPIQDASVNMKSNSTLTDENGYFDISGFAVEGHGVLKVSKAGFYDAFPVFNAGPVKQYVEVQMIPREESGIISSTSGGEVMDNSGAAVTFSANSFVDENGNAYDGAVTVYMHYLDPTIEAIAEVMPGDLSAIDLNNNTTLLTSLGMLNVELEGSTGQKLDINKAASITVPVPQSILSMAPASIPLWYFDEDSGYWIEEGEAILSNGVYTGEVEHFTFWNCDVPNDFVNLEGQISIKGAPIQTRVQISVEATGDKRSTKTDLSGAFSGKVPNGVSLILELFDQCGASVYTESLGVLNEDTTLDPIWLANSSLFTHLEGPVVDCDGNPVQNGYCRVKTNLSSKITVLSIQDGEIDGAVAVCDANKIEIVAYDTDNLEFGSTVEFEVVEEINVSLIACGNVINEGVLFEHNGAPLLHFIGCDVDLSETGAYRFTFVDDQDNGNKILYDHVFVDWNQNPNNPSFAFTTYWQAFGDINHYYSISGGDSKFIDHQTELGEYLIMEQSNCTVTKHNSAGDITETYDGVTITYTGLVQ